MCQAYGFTWKLLQSDAEHVITKGAVKALLDTLKVKPRISVPYLHWQNGFIERHIGMTQDLATTYMLYCNAKPCFLEYAIKHAVIMMNECRIPDRMTTTPYEKFHGSLPDWNN
jgi:hypothetical protein